MAGTTGVRKMVATTAVQYLDQLSHDADGGGDRSLTREVADGYLKVGDLLGNPGTNNLGDRTGAAASYAKSLALCQALTKSDPTDGVAAVQLARTTIAVGELQDAAAGPAAALPYFTRARAVAAARLAVVPADALAARTVAFADLHISRATARLGHAADALAPARASVAEYEAVARATAGQVTTGPATGPATRPSVADDDAAAELSRAHDVLADMLADLGRVAESMAEHNAALAITRRRVAADPRNANARRDLSQNLNQIATAEARAGQFADAVARQGESVEICRDLAAAEPANVRAARDLGVAYVDRGRYQAQGGNVAACLTDYQANLDVVRRLVRDDPGNESLNYSLALALRYVGVAQGVAGQRTEAVATLTAARDLLRTALDAPHPTAEARHTMGVVQSQLANLQAQAGDTDGALATLRAVVADAERTAADDPGNVAAELAVADAYIALGDAGRASVSGHVEPYQLAAAVKRGEAAMASYDHALDLIGGLLGKHPGDPAVVFSQHKALFDRALLKARGNDAEGALSDYEQALAVSRRRARAHPDDTAATFALFNDAVNVARTESELDRYDLAVGQLAEVRPTVAAVIGPDPSDTVLAHNTIAFYSAAATAELAIAHDLARPAAARSAAATAALADALDARRRIARLVARHGLTRADAKVPAYVDRQVDDARQLLAAPATSQAAATRPAGR